MIMDDRRTDKGSNAVARISSTPATVKLHRKA